MRAMLRPLLLVFISVATFAAFAADAGPAAEHAADLMRARAQRLRTADSESARVLDRLADDVRSGRVSLADAEAVLRIASALPVSAPPAGAHSPGRPPGPPAPAMSPEHATALLDGTTPPDPRPSVPPAPRPPSASAAATTPVAPPATTPSAAATVLSAAPVPVAPTPNPALTAPPRVQARVLAIERGSDAKAALVAIDAGLKQGVKEGDRFAIQRQGATRVLARASKVSEDMTIALIIPGTWTDERAEIAQDDTAVSVDDR